jgi:poly [ADP-ribose] polymerase
MAKVKAWKNGQPGEPYFPATFNIKQKAVLQVTDIKTNRNKYYAIELHATQEKGQDFFRVYTHYGRTDDLDRDPNSGQKECRYFGNLPEAVANYQSIYNEKTAARKGYKEISLASSNIGSHMARGTSSGNVDDKTLKKIAEKEQAAASKTQAAPPVSQLPAAIQQLVRYIYDEATSALTSTVNAKITANGITTPLGVLTIGQIEKGEGILTTMYGIFQQNGSTKRDSQLEDLSSEFYTVIPHRIGRTRAAVAEAVINSLEAFQQKQDTLQLMKDMLQVNGETGSVLFDAKVDDEYKALGCTIEPVEAATGIFQEIKEYVEGSQIKMKSIRVQNVFKLRRGKEAETFNGKVGNERLLFHGSRIQNWVGILTRGILMPKIVTAMGVNRTDAGWLGNGIYFGDAACTSSFYTSAGRKQTRFMAIANVALGKQKQYHNITYGLNAPPAGFDSCHGVRRQKNVTSQFDDDEYVIYDPRQQRLEYLVEFVA